MILLYFWIIYFLLVLSGCWDFGCGREGNIILLGFDDGIVWVFEMWIFFLSFFKYNKVFEVCGVSVYSILDIIIGYCIYCMECKDCLVYMVDFRRIE